MSDMHSLEDAYNQLVEALNYLEEHGEDPTPQGGDIFLVGKTSDVMWNRFAKKFEFKIHMGLGRDETSE